jgi:hypothetical protein
MAAAASLYRTESRRGLYHCSFASIGSPAAFDIYSG